MWCPCNAFENNTTIWFCSFPPDSEIISLTVVFLLCPLTGKRSLKSDTHSAGVFVCLPLSLCVRVWDVVCTFIVNRAESCQSSLFSGENTSWLGLLSELTPSYSLFFYLALFRLPLSLLHPLIFFQQTIHPPSHHFLPHALKPFKR